MTDANGALDAHVVVRRPAFDLDVAFEVQPRTTLALLGPNGAGKSTTFAAIAGLPGSPRLDAGRIALGDVVFDDPDAGVSLPPERRGVGLMFQDHLLFHHLTVADNVAFGPRSLGLGRRAAREVARRWLDEVGLADLGARHPTELSGGQAQRVALARTMAAAPRLLLFDEPLAALDVRGRADLRRLLRMHLAALEGPSEIVTHDPTDAFLLADRIAVIEHGRVSQIAEADEIRHRPATPYIGALTGTNLYAGTARDGDVLVDDREHLLHIADRSIEGHVLCTIRPEAVSLHAGRPDGSQRNVWHSAVEIVEPVGDRVRVTLGDPLPTVVDVTPGAVDALGLRPGSSVWAAVKATEIGVDPVAD